MVTSPNGEVKSSSLGVTELAKTNGCPSLKGVQGAKPPAVLDTYTAICNSAARAGADPIVAILATVGALKVKRLLDQGDPGRLLRAMLRADGQEKRATRQADCCTRWRAAKCLIHGDVQRLSPNQCGIPGCPVCQGYQAKKRAVDWERRFRVIMRQYPAGPGRSGWRLSLVTVTLRSGSSAGESLDAATLLANLRRVHAAFRRLWDKHLVMMGSKDGAPVPGMGAVSKGEFGVNGACHLHVLMWGPRPNAQWLQTTWKKLTGSWQTNVQKVTPRRKNAKGVKSRWRGAFAELVKYVTKPATHIDRGLLNASVALALAGVRNYRSYGSLLEWRRILGYGPSVHGDRIAVQDECPYCISGTAWAWGAWASSKEEAIEALATASPRGPPGGAGAERVDPVTGEVSYGQGTAQVFRALAGAAFGRTLPMLQKCCAPRRLVL